MTGSSFVDFRLDPKEDLKRIVFQTPERWRFFFNREGIVQRLALTGVTNAPWKVFRVEPQILEPKGLIEIPAPEE
jgi:hypothetical protein